MKNMNEPDEERFSSEPAGREMTLEEEQQAIANIKKIAGVRESTPEEDARYEMQLRQMVFHCCEAAIHVELAICEADGMGMGTGDTRRCIQEGCQDARRRFPSITQEIIDAALAEHYGEAKSQPFRVTLAEITAKAEVWTKARSGKEAGEKVVAALEAAQNGGAVWQDTIWEDADFVLPQIIGVHAMDELEMEGEEPAIDVP